MRDRSHLPCLGKMSTPKNETLDKMYGDSQPHWMVTIGPLAAIRFSACCRGESGVSAIGWLTRIGWSRGCIGWSAAVIERSLSSRNGRCGGGPTRGVPPLPRFTTSPYAHMVISRCHDSGAAGAEASRCGTGLGASCYTQSIARVIGFVKKRRGFAADARRSRREEHIYIIYTYISGISARRLVSAEKSFLPPKIELSATIGKLRQVSVHPARYVTRHIPADYGKRHIPPAPPSYAQSEHKRDRPAAHYVTRHIPAPQATYPRRTAGRGCPPL